MTDPGVRAVAIPRAAASSGWISSVQRSRPVMSDGTLCIHELFERTWRRLTRTRPRSASESAARRRGTSATMYSGRQLDAARRRADHLVEARHHRAEVDAVGLGDDLLEREAVRVVAVALAPGPRTDLEVEQPVGTAAGRRGDDLGRVSALDPRSGQLRDARDEPGEEELIERFDAHVRRLLALHDRREDQQDLPLGGSIGRGREDGLRVLRGAPHRPAPLHLVVVGLLEDREAGQDHVGVPGRLVQPVVDGDHAVELGQRGVEPVAARRRDDRIARDGEQRPDAALPGRRDLLGEARDRELPKHLGRAAHPRPEAVEREAVGELGRGQPR